MPIMEWSNQLDIGVNNMNDQHQELLKLMNALYDKHSSGSKLPQVKADLDALAAFTVKHFKEEEEFMAKIKFERLPEHKVIHVQLLEKFNQFVSEAQKKGELSQDFFNFLKFWLVAHIQGIDKKYGDFSKNNKAA